MLLKFAYEETDDSKNTTEKNIKYYHQLLKPFIEYCIVKGLNNVEDVRHLNIRD